MKVKLKIPTDLSEIKLSQYQKFLKTTKDSEDTKFIEKQLVAIFCNIPDKIVNSINKRDFDNVVNTLSNILQDDTKPTLKRIIKYNGVEYGFIPDFDEITLGEQIDIDTQINDWDKMHKVMGVMYRPITAKVKDSYLIEEYKGDGVELDLPLDVVFGAMVFFCDLLKDLLICTQNYIKAELLNKKSQILEKNGDGIKQSMELLEVTFLNLITLLNSNYTKLYYS